MLGYAAHSTKEAFWPAHSHYNMLLDFSDPTKTDADKPPCPKLYVSLLIENLLSQCGAYESYMLKNRFECIALPFYLASLAGC